MRFHPRRAKEQEKKQLQRSRVITWVMAATAFATAIWKGVASVKASPKAYATIDSARQKTMSFARSRRGPATITG